MKRFIYISLILALFLVFNSCDTPLSKYEPKNDEEKNIVALLNTYCDARNRGDIVTLHSLFDDKGQYISARGAILTKKEIAESEPNWWKEGGELKILNSEFNIDGNKATVRSTGKWGVHFKTPHVCTLVKNDNKWLFIKVKTGN